MKLIVCLDIRNGMSFNGRRQSRDRAVIRKIEELTNGSTVRMNPKSIHLFDTQNISVIASESFLRDALTDDWCFVEWDDVTPYLRFAGTIVVFRWQRAYPYDVVFPYDRIEADYFLWEKSEFVGNSHSTIAMEVYNR